MAKTGGEDLLHELFRAAFAPLPGRSGPGDDCALLRPPPGAGLVVSCDQVVAGVHTEAGAPPAVLARKLLRRSLSDLAAAGAEPWAALWTVAAPAGLDLAWMKRLARAFLREAALFRCPVVGGDLSNAATIVLTCTVIGRTGRRRPPGRGGARPGQLLGVTGRLGGAVQSGRHLRPTPRLREGHLLAHLYRAAAMMDLSDGLARDLPRLLGASRAGARIHLDALPLGRGLRPGWPGWMAALGDGEDYELLVALRPAQARRAAADPLLRRTGFHIIGEVTAAPRIQWLAAGQPVIPTVSGWEHQWR